jgi:hypothetical protein
MTRRKRCQDSFIVFGDQKEWQYAEFLGVLNQRMARGDAIFFKRGTSSTPPSVAPCLRGLPLRVGLVQAAQSNGMNRTSQSALEGLQR